MCTRVFATLIITLTPTHRSKLENWDSESDEDPLAPAGGAPPPGNSRLARVVVLRYMFTLDELDKDPALALELKDDVREEAEKIGVVTNVVLYDVRPSQRGEGRTRQLIRAALPACRRKRTA